MLRLVLISLVAAAVVARPTFPDLHQNEKSEAIEISKVTEFKPGEEPKQSTDVRLIKDGQAIPIERQQRRALNPEIKNQQSNVQQPGEDSQLKSSEPLMDDLQESKRQALDVDLRGPQDPSAQSQLESGQRQLQSENEESLGLRQQRMQDIQRPDDQQLPETTPAIEQTSPSSDKEEERDDGIARISLFRTIIVILSHKMSPVEDEQLLDSLQPEKQPELEEPLNAEVEKQPDINSGVLKRRQLRQQGPPLPPLPPQSSFVEIPAGRQRGHESIQRPVGRQWEQSELEPPVMMQKRDVHQKLHQERLDQQGNGL